MRKIVLALLVAISYGAIAQETDRVSLPAPKMGNWQVSDPAGLWPFIGGGLGYSDHNDSVRTEGMPTNLKILGSYYFENRKIVADLGVGAFNHFLTQSGGGSDLIVSPNVELGGRWRFAKGWQAGPSWMTVMGTDRYNSVNDQNTSFVGLQALREFTLDNRFLLRVGGKWMTDVDVPNENVNMAMLEVALGFAPTRSGQAVASQPIAEAKGRNIPLAYSKGPVRVAEFELTSGELDNIDERRLESLATALRAEPGLVGEIEVVGHADPSGPDALNNRLARERAVAVAGTLARYGIDDDALTVTSKGASEPVVQSLALEDLAKSRRVELRFKSVSDQARLAEILNDLFN